MNEIEKMKKIICSVEGTPCSDCPFRFNRKCAAEINATTLANAGYGDVKQAVREFAEILKENCTFDGHRVALDKNRIDELVKEVCGE